MTDQRGQHDPTAFYDMDDTSALPLTTVNDGHKPSSWRQFWTSAQYAAANGEEGDDEARRQSVIDDSLTKVVAQDRKSVVEGKCVSVRVDLGERSISQKKKKINKQ